MNKQEPPAGRMLCLWLPNWPIQRLVAGRPELKGRPLALDAPHRGGRRVAACCGAAHRCGVRRQMPVDEAEALISAASRRDKLHLQPHDPEADRHELEHLAQWCEAFSPVVGLDEGETPEGLFFDITGIARLFGGESMLAEKILLAFSHRNLSVRLSIADTLGASWAVAHFAYCEGATAGLSSSAATSHRSTAGQASSGTQQHNHVTIIPTGKTLDALRPLPIEALRLSKKNVALLGELGVTQIDQLLRLPREGFLSRLGSDVLRRIDQATGAAAEPVRVARRRPVFEIVWPLDVPTTRGDQIERLLQHLIERLADQLAQQTVGATGLRCRLYCEHGGPVEFTVGLFRPSADAGHLWELAHMHLERLRLPGAVSELSVRVTATALLECRQQQLFGDEGPLADRRQLAVLIDRLGSRLGRQAVLRPCPASEAQPELACRYVPLTALAAKRPRASRGPASGPAHRPLYLLPRPVAIKALSIAPDGPPLRFTFNHAPHQVHRHWGPERIETGWWRRRSAGRDYYRIETDRGARFWLFRRLNDGQWFLHGAFD